MFYPLNLVRPTYDLLIGPFSIKKRIEFYLSFSFTSLYWVRRHLISLYPKNQLFSRYSIEDESEYVFLSSCFLVQENFDIPLDTIFVDQGDVLSFRILGKNLRKIFEIYDFDFNPILDKKAFLSILYKFLRKIDIQVKYKKLESLIDCLEEKDKEIKNEYKKRRNKIWIFLRLWNKKKVYIGQRVKFIGKSCLNDEYGPIIIEDDVKIIGYSYIEGPTYIGKGVELYGARIQASSIHEYCKIGAEVSNSILYPCMNHAHKGYIGHSIVGSFVNFGAMTVLSDLKANYKHVIMNIGRYGKIIKTRRLKMGSLIGDYNKFSIASLIYSGTIVGIGNSLFFDGKGYSENIPSFVWGGSIPPYKKYIFEKFIQEISPVLERRNQKITLEKVEIFENIFNNELDWRETFLK